LGDHDRTSFVCGIYELDRYFHHQATQDARRKVAAPFVLLDEGKKVLGYYTLSAYSVQLAELPPDLSKKLPKYPLLPATMLGRLAIHREYQGKKLGQFLLMDALYRSWKNTTEVASMGVVAEAYDDSAREFYLRHSFISLAGHPNKLFIAMKTIKTAFD
jgi:GNAT superfamily N-acetyltransferase